MLMHLLFNKNANVIMAHSSAYNVPFVLFMELGHFFFSINVNWMFQFLCKRRTTNFFFKSLINTYSAYRMFCSQFNIFLEGGGACFDNFVFLQINP